METNTYPEVTRKILKKADRNIPVPFELKLYEHEQSLICEKVVRIIPGKRVVVFGKWDNKPIVAKLFFEWRKAKTHIERDVKGIDALRHANIPTPSLYFQGTNESKQIHVLIFERIMNSCSLDILWQEKVDVSEITKLMRAVTIELATQHVMGIVQKDLHLKNFLVTSKTIFTLDGGSIYHHPELLPKKESIEHLALFFAQLGTGTQALQDELFQLYAQSRSWIVRPTDIELLEQTKQRLIAERWNRYQRKIMRNCTSFFAEQRFTSFDIFDRDYMSDEFKALLNNPDSYLIKPETKILKAGRSSTIAKVIIDGNKIAIKRYNMKNFFHWLRRCLRPTRAVKSWQLAHQLRHAGIYTAKPIAFIEKRFFGLRHKSYFVMEYIDGQMLGDYLDANRSDESAITAIAKRIVILFKQLTELQLTHGDLKISNIIVHHDRPILIDLDGMRQHKNKLLFDIAYKKEIKRFLRNWDSQPTLQQLFKQLLG